MDARQSRVVLAAMAGEEPVAAPTFRRVVATAGLCRVGCAGRDPAARHPRAGEITLKAGGGAYAPEAFPERWHRIVREAVDIRTNRECTRSLYGRSIVRRRRDARACIVMVIEGALAR